MSTANVDLHAAEIAGASRAEEAKTYLEHIRKMAPKTDADLRFLVSAAAEIKELAARHAEQRDGFIADAKRIMDRAKAYFGPGLDYLAQCEREIKTLIVKVDEHRAVARRRLIDEARYQGMQGDRATADKLIAKADANSMPKIPGLSLRRSITASVDDRKAAVKWCIDNARAELLTVDAKAIEALAKTDALPDIEGVSVATKVSPAITVSKVERDA